MLETGLALIAVNLPSIWGLVSHSSITSFLDSLKGLFALRSPKHTRDDISRRYVGLDDDEWRIRKSSSDQASQDIRLVENERTDSLTMRNDLESCYQSEPVNDHRRLNEDGIEVRMSITQTETHDHTLTKT